MARIAGKKRVLEQAQQRTATSVVEDLWGILVAQKEQVEELDRWYRNRLAATDLPGVPKTQNEHHVALRDKSNSGWPRLVVSTVSQALYLDGMRTKDSRDNSALWDIWQNNGFDAGQIAVHRAALAHGMSYVKITLEEDPLTGVKVPRLRGVSAKRMTAIYADDGDQFPQYALEAVPQRQADGKVTYLATLYDDTYATYFEVDGGKFAYIAHERHGLRVPPIVRYACLVDLDGQVDGEIAPFIPLFGRIDQDTFDRLVVQRFGAFKVRFGTGIEKPKTDSEQRAASAQLREGDLLMAADAKATFGTLDGTPLDGYIKARDSDLRDLASVTQTPPHHLLGAIANLSAEALAAAESSLMRKVDERKHGFGESHEMTLRLAGQLGTAEQRAAALDFDTQVRWKDTESRSLNQVADALAKVATSLGIPVEMLWERLPDWTAADTEDAKRLIKEGNSVDALLAEAELAMKIQEKEAGGGNNGGGNQADGSASGGAS